MDTTISYSLIANDMQAVDAVIRARLYSDVPLVRQIAEYIIAGGGKRLRPALLLLSAFWHSSRAVALRFIPPALQRRLAPLR